MTRFFCRLAGMVALSIALILATVDTLRSIAASAPVLTPLAESWAFGSPETFASVLDHLGAYGAAGKSFLGLLNLPGSTVFLAVAVLLLIIGRRRRHPANDRVAI